MCAPARAWTSFTSFRPSTRGQGQGVGQRRAWLARPYALPLMESARSRSRAFAFARHRFPFSASHDAPPSLPSLFHQVLVADLASPSTDLPRAGPVAPAPERFTRVAWGSIGADGPHPVSLRE